MTVSTTTSGVTRTGDGVTLEFSFSFEARLAAEIFVSEIVGLTLTPIDPAGYVVAINPNGVGGTVTFTVAPDNGANLYIFRETSQTQLVSVSNQTRYNPEVVEGVWDKHAFLIQELAELANRSVKTVPGGDPDALIETLETSAASAAADAAAAAASAAAAALFDPGNLAGLIALTLSANKLAYPTGASTWALTDFTVAARALLDDADATAMRATLGLVLGTNVQAYSAFLAQIAGIGASLVAGDILLATAANALARLAKGTDDQMLTMVSGSPAWAAAPRLAQQTLQSAPLALMDWTGVPANCSEIYIFFLELSGSATAQNLVQLMVSGVPVTTGYYNTGGLTSGFSLPSLTAGQTGTGIMHLMRVNGNTWVMNSGASGTTGWKTFSGAVDGVRLIPSTGTFDAGQGGCAWRP